MWVSGGRWRVENRLSRGGGGLAEAKVARIGSQRSSALWHQGAGERAVGRVGSKTRVSAAASEENGLWQDKHV
jgi:hypothetical protein